ncbi:MAG: hypothetical protein QOC82_2556 [Frankiaceae bacterium]|jgi:hypothetical protein|nr:hypothetical protein [Frankiaceae bacterium]
MSARRANGEDGCLDALASVGGVRMTEFWDRMRGRFGPAYAASVARDQVIRSLGDRTAHEALAAGEDPKVVWLAVCEHFEAPVRDRH